MPTSLFSMISALALVVIVPCGTYAQFDAQDSANLDDAAAYLRLINTDVRTIELYVRWLEEHQAEFEPQVLSNLWDIAASTYYSTLLQVEGFESVTNQLSATDTWLYRTLVTDFQEIQTHFMTYQGTFAGSVYSALEQLAALRLALVDDLVVMNRNTGVYSWKPYVTNHTSLLTNLREINAKLPLSMPSITITNEVSVTNATDIGIFTNFYTIFNESDFDSAGWSSFRELAVDYYDANYQEVSTNEVSMQEWTELNIWERISTALYRLVSPQGTAPDTDGIGSALESVGDILEDNWDSVEDVDQTENYTTAFQRLASQLNTFQFEGMGDYNNLTLVPEFDWPLGGDVNYHFQGIIIHPADDGVVRVVARLFRQVFGWLWSFLLVLSFIYLTIGTSTGVIYLFTWASSCAGQMKILPFDWSKVWHNPLEYLKLGDW